MLTADLTPRPHKVYMKHSVMCDFSLCEAQCEAAACLFKTAKPLTTAQLSSLNLTQTAAVS